MTLEEDKKGLRILHFALCFGALFIILILHYFVKEIDFGTTSNKLGLIEMGALVLASTNLLLANFLFKKKTADIERESITKENIEQWRGAYILKWALLEGALLVNIQIHTFIGNNAILAIVALLLLLLLYVSKPKLD